MRALIVPGLVSAGLVLLAGEQEARACSALACVDLYSLPAARKTVPANVPGLLVRPMADRSTRPPAGEFLLELSTEGRPIAVGVEHFQNTPAYVVVPLSPLLPDTDHVILAADLCEPDGSTTSIAFRTGPPAPLPRSLGQLELTAPEIGSVNVEAPAQCTVGVRSSYANVSLVLSDEAEPWAEVLVYETTVDGVAWRPSAFLPSEIPVGSSWRGRGRDAVYAPCEAFPLGVFTQSLTEGSHDVVMRATLPGTSFLLETSPVVVNLSCTPEGTPDPEPTPDPEETPDPPGQNPEGEAQPGSLGLGRGCACSGAETSAPNATVVALAALAALGLLAPRRSWSSDG